MQYWNFISIYFYVMITNSAFKDAWMKIMMFYDLMARSIIMSFNSYFHRIINELDNAWWLHTWNKEEID